MKKIAIILSIILAMGVLSSCGKQNTSSSAPVQSTSTPASSSAPASTSSSTSTSALSSTSAPASQNIEGSLSDIMVKLYVGTENDVPKTMDTELVEENSVGYVGVKRKEYKEGLGSDAMINAQAHSVCLVRAESAEAAAALAKLIDEKADPNKWVCKEAEKKEVKQSGDLVLLVMTNTVAADKILANFDALTK